MKFGDIRLRNSDGEIINLRDLKELKKSDLKWNSALINIFERYDVKKADGTNGADGILSEEELVSLFMDINSAAKYIDNPSVFDINEAEMYLNKTKTPDGKTLKEQGVDTSDLFDFILKLTKKYKPLDSENELTADQKEKLEEIKNDPEYEFMQLSEAKKEFIIASIKYNIDVAPAWVFTNGKFNDDEFSEEILSNFKKALSDKNFEITSFFEAQALAKLNDEQYANATKLYTTYSSKGFSINSIAEWSNLCKPEDKEYLNSLIKMTDEPTNLDPYFITWFLQIEEPYREKFFSIIEDKNIPPQMYARISILMPIWDALPDNFIEKYNDFSIERSRDGGLGFYLPDNRTSYLYTKDDGLYEIRTLDDGNNSLFILNTKTKTISEIQYKTVDKMEVLVSEVIKEYDNITINDLDNWTTGNLVKTTVRTQGSVEGVYNITETDAQGNVKPIQFESVDEAGNIYVQKDFVSPLGVETHFVYEETVDGIVILDYVITAPKDKEEGNNNNEQEILLDRHQTIQQMNDGKVITTINGKIYEAIFEDNKLIIMDKTNNITKTLELDSDFITKGNNIIINILKNVPANQLMVMDKIPISAIYYDKDSQPDKSNNAYWNMDKRHIEIRNQDRLQTAIEQNDYRTILDGMLPIFMHEFGHYLDSDLITGYCSTISSDQYLNNIFIKEYTKFLKVTNSEQQKYIEYFIDIDSPDAIKRSPQERVAESNLLLNSMPNEILANRANYFQQYFPETIAKISELIDARIEKNIN